MEKKNEEQKEVISPRIQNILVLLRSQRDLARRDNERLYAILGSSSISGQFRITLELIKIKLKKLWQR